MLTLVLPQARFLRHPTGVTPDRRHHRPAILANLGGFMMVG
jgi:hypothetical protein